MVQQRPGAPDTTRVDGVAHRRRAFDSAEDIPANARWVPGVGYVVEDS